MLSTFVKYAQKESLSRSFGRAEFPEEAFIKSMDAKTGASLKLTILNVTGRVWTMVAGGGASVVYADTICDLGFAFERAASLFGKNLKEQDISPHKSRDEKSGRWVW